MTIYDTSNKINYVADGIATAYDYGFRVDDADYMEVYFDGELVTTGGYSVTGIGDENGGQVVFDVAPTLDVNITLLRNTDETQLVDYVPYDAFPANVHEFALDKLTMIVQELKEILDRTITAAPDAPADADYSLPSYDAGKGLMFSEDSYKLETSNDNFNDIVSSALASANAASASASDASASQNKAYEWAENPEDDPVEPDLYSAFHWAQKAAAWTTGVPSETRMIFYNTSSWFNLNMLGWVVVSVGDCVVGISDGVSLYAGVGPGVGITPGVDLSNSLTVTAINEDTLLSLMVKDTSNRVFNVSGSAIIPDDGLKTAQPTIVTKVTEADGFEAVNQAWYTDREGHTHIASATVADDGTFRPRAVVCIVGEKS